MTLAPVPSPAPRRVAGRLLFASLWLIGVVVLVAFRRVLLPFAIAFVLAYLLEPLVSRLSRRRLVGRLVPRWTAVIACYLGFLGVVSLYGLFAVPQLYLEFARLSAEGREFLTHLTPDRVVQASQDLERWLLSQGVPVDFSGSAAEGGQFTLRLNMERALKETAAKLSDGLRTHFLDAVGAGQRFVGDVLGSVFRFFFILMVTAFLLIDWARIGSFATSLVPAGRKADFAVLLREIDRRLSGVVRGQVIICLINGALTFVGLLLLGVKFAFVLSTIAMVLSLIPIFGTILSSVPIVLIGMTQGWQVGLGALAWIVGIHALEAYFLNPKIMGSHANIHPALVAFSLLAGEQTFGFTGALFAVPIAAIVVAVFAFVHERARALDELPAKGPLAAEPKPVVAPLSASPADAPGPIS